MKKQDQMNKVIIERYKDMTGYFNDTLSVDYMYDLFRNRCQFGEAETNVIISALELAGAKFKH